MAVTEITPTAIEYAGQTGSLADLTDAANADGSWFYCRHPHRTFIFLENTNAAARVMTITGQKAVVTKARKSIAGFKLRQGMSVGTMVTLRGQRMYEFLDRLISIVIPRIRDFRGFSTRAFDGRGNYTLGVKEQVIFPEIDYDKIEKLHGLDITFVTSTDKDDQAFALLKELGLPFRQAGVQDIPILA